MTEILENEKAAMAEINEQKAQDIKVAAEKKAEAAERVKKSRSVLGLVDKSMW